jgi:hypothetical protein
MLINAVKTLVIHFACAFQRLGVSSKELEPFLAFGRLRYLFRSWFHQMVEYLTGVKIQNKDLFTHMICLSDFTV